MRAAILAVLMVAGCAESVTIPEDDASVAPDVPDVAVDTRCLDEAGELRGEGWVCERLTRARVQCEIDGASVASIVDPQSCSTAGGAWVYRDVIVLCDGVEIGCAGNVTIGGYLGACDVGPLGECSGREL